MSGAVNPEIHLANTVIRTVCDEIKELLVEKNTLYGNAALNPINVFSPLGAEDAIRVRLDDKLKRLGAKGDDEDQEFDIIGYLVLMRVNRELLARELSREGACNCGAGPGGANEGLAHLPNCPEYRV